MDLEKFPLFKMKTYCWGTPGNRAGQLHSYLPPTATPDFSGFSSSANHGGSAFLARALQHLLSLKSSHEPSEVEFIIPILQWLRQDRSAAQCHRAKTQWEQDLNTDVIAKPTFLTWHSPASQDVALGEKASTFVPRTGGRELKGKGKEENLHVWICLLS